ncbi:type II toxin-antitoxin system VapC family toxin [Synechococcus moorigangaii CMS01]|nr:type II toxin-antitoxin system VapC family toxin [Synechococcus moorigangaii CMS01]
MQVLLDTHISLWYIEGDQKLSQSLREVIEFLADDLYLSITSLWEIAIKVNLGKLQLDCGFSKLESILDSINIKLLDITFQDLEIYRDLPLHHRDPFDRLIIAQAKHHNYSLVSKDVIFKKYDVPLIWE